jgi:hypothetical protein
VKNARHYDLDGDVGGDDMKRLTRFALLHVPSLVICLLSFGGLCFAQEPPEAAPGAGGRGSVFAPSGWMELIIPVQKRIDVKPYGFYIGNLKAPVGQLDVSIRATKFLTITPSYMDYSVPASGLNELPSQPAQFTRSYEERQFRIDGEFMFASALLIAILSRLCSTTARIHVVIKPLRLSKSCTCRLEWCRPGANLAFS